MGKCNFRGELRCRIMAIQRKKHIRCLNAWTDWLKQSLNAGDKRNIGVLMMLMQQPIRLCLHILYLIILLMGSKSQ
eukprot:snap_masked-scaffold_35-processed-gene-2.10-mRNA-1 protein AED:1.00 eAED:1.00 QI:0/0/0/0/1/1/2/0/75